MMITIIQLSNSRGHQRHAWIRLLTLSAAASIPMLSALADDGTLHRLVQNFPISLGTSGGNIHGYNDGVTPVACCSATLGALVQDQLGNQYILGSNLGLALQNAAAPGDAITQPGTRDYLCSPSPYNVVGSLSAYVPMLWQISKNNKPINYVNAAIAQVVPGAVRSDGAILDIGPVNPALAAPAVNLPVKKSGRGTGLTRGRIKAINVTIDANFRLGCGGSGEGRNGRFASQFKIDLTAQIPADSGALVVVDELGAPRPVGVVWASSPSIILAYPIDIALAQLAEQLGPGVTLSFPPLAGSLSSSMQSAAFATASSDLTTDSKLSRALKAQHRHADALFNVPDVVGHGIGLGDDEQPVVEVYLQNENARSRSRIPSALDDVPVRVIVTGPITAN